MQIVTSSDCSAMGRNTFESVADDIGIYPIIEGITLLPHVDIKIYLYIILVCIYVRTNAQILLKIRCPVRLDRHTFFFSEVMN